MEGAQSNHEPRELQPPEPPDSQNDRLANQNSCNSYVHV